MGANTKFGSGYLALVGGIQLNMPKGYPDYFLPCHFTIQKRDCAPTDALKRLTSQEVSLNAMRSRPLMCKQIQVPVVKKELTRDLGSSLELNFPGALPGPVIHE